MSKLIQALLSGIFVTFILDFFLFLGLFQNYIRPKEIDLYYNILFADNQNIIIFVVFTILLSYILVYTNTKLSLIVVGILSTLSLSTLISPIGEIVGTAILSSKNVTIQTQKFSYTGDIYYKGRENITLYDYKLKKIIILNKNNIKGKY